MTNPPNSKQGSCRCGHVQFTATPPALLTMACHCKGCQRMTASAFSLSEMYASASFVVTSGEPVRGGMKADPHHYVCPDCASWIFTRLSSPIGDFVNVRATMFDECDDAPPFIETCTDEKLAWVQTNASHSFSSFPSREVFGGLIGAFMERPK
jgi:hypothetical protein